MRARIDIINGLIEENGYKSYFEIGLGDGSHFDGVKLLDKYGVDPNLPDLIKTGLTKEQTSDEFFEWYSKECSEDSGHKFDLIFIDGLHHSDQVERDIVNSWKCLNKAGIILIHDIKPKNYEEQVVPMGDYPTWTGDVWRAWNGLKKKYGTLNLDYIDEENGLGVIYKSRHKIELGFVDMASTWEEYDQSQAWKV
jgi:hypothetical protein